MKIYLVALSLIIAAAGCEMPEKPIKPFDRGGVSTETINLTSNYKFQVFYNLDSQRVVKSVNRMDWDLAFDCSNNHVILTNSGRGIYVAATNQTDLAAVNDTVGLKFYWGQPSLDKDSLAFGAWWTQPGKVFVLDMGSDLNGIPLGFMKCIPELTSENKLKLTYCAIESKTPKHIEVIKDSRFLFSYVSLLNDATLEVEPPKDQWDFLFTQYVKLLFDPPYPATRNYEVVGVLHNTTRLEVGYDFKTPFKDISSKNIPSKFYTNRDAIGFDWKWFEIGTNSYTVNPGMNYILKTESGFYYKLHFLDFYDDKGVKGFPKFEYQKI